MESVMKTRFACFVLLCLSVFAAPAIAQERPYGEGPVVNVSAIRTLDGQFENYLDYLQKNWKPAQEEAKKAGYVLEYHVYSTQPRSPNDPNLYLVVTYPNMAMLDDIEGKMDPIMKKVLNQDFKQADEASGKRQVMRTLVGSELLRELKLK
jgi:hypothetical protein